MKHLYFIFLLLSIASYGQVATADLTIPQEEIAGFKLYPNPAANGIVYVTTDANETKDIRVYDVFGELLLTDRITGKIVDISKLTTGVYMLQVIEGANAINRKLIIR